MKFQIIPDKQEQICRLIAPETGDKQGEVYLMADDPSAVNDEEMLNVISLTDLQRNVSNPALAPKLLIKKNGLTVAADNLEKYVQSWNYAIKVPYTMKAHVITDIEDVKQFFRDIHMIYDAEFHPDDDFKDFTGKDDNPSFTDEEAEYLNMIMTNCFQVCDDSNVEIYDVAGEVQIERWKEKGIWPKDN